jgi:hypothetical protein
MPMARLVCWAAISECATALDHGRQECPPYDLNPNRGLDFRDPSHRWLPNPISEALEFARATLTTTEEVRGTYERMLTTEMVAGFGNE